MKILFGGVKERSGTDWNKVVISVPSYFHSRSPAVLRGAEQVIVVVSDQAAYWLATIGGVVEADQGYRGAGIASRGFGDLERRAVAVRTTEGCRAKQIAVGVGDQAGMGVGDRWCGRS
jgi:hypothetical protein